MRQQVKTYKNVATTINRLDSIDHISLRNKLIRIGILLKDVDLFPFVPLLYHTSAIAQILIFFSIDPEVHGELVGLVVCHTSCHQNLRHAESFLADWFIRQRHSKELLVY